MLPPSGGEMTPSMGDLAEGVDVVDDCDMVGIMDDGFVMVVKR